MTVPRPGPDGAGRSASTATVGACRSPPASSRPRASDSVAARTAIAVVAVLAVAVVLLAGASRPKNQAAAPARRATPDRGGHRRPRARTTGSSSSGRRAARASARRRRSRWTTRIPSGAVDRPRARPRQGHRRQPFGLAAPEPGRPRRLGRRLRRTRSKSWSARTSRGSSTWSGSTRAACSAPRRSVRRRARRWTQLIADRPRLLDRRRHPGGHRRVRRARRRRAAEHGRALLGHVDTSARRRTWTSCARRSATTSSRTSASPTARSSAPPTPRCFPRRVGRLVLDGAAAPTLTSARSPRARRVGFESALRAYVDGLPGRPRCPLSGSVDDGLAQIRGLLDRARAEPAAHQHRPATSPGSLAFYGHRAAAVRAVTTGRYLTPGADRGAPAATTARRCSRSPTSTTTASPDGTYTHELDGRVQRDQLPGQPRLRRLRDDARRGRPDRGRRAHRRLVLRLRRHACARSGRCPRWAGLDSYAAEGAAPILVVGTTNDPATPYRWRSSWPTCLSSGALLTYEGEGHTAYGSSNDCIAGAVDAYLLSGRVPRRAPAADLRLGLPEARRRVTVTAWHPSLPPRLSGGPARRRPGARLVVRSALLGWAAGARSSLGPGAPTLTSGRGPVVRAGAAFASSASWWRTSCPARRAASSTAVP